MSVARGIVFRAMEVVGMKMVRGVAVIVGILLLAGCGAKNVSAPAVSPTAVTPAGNPTATEPVTEPSASRAPDGPPALAISVADGATVPVDTLITVTPTRGKVTEVTVTSTASGRNAVQITGAVNPAGVWEANSRLDPAARYVVTAEGTAEDGAELTARSAFTTSSLNRTQEVFPTLTPVQGGPFGVAQPVIVQFDVPVADKAAFERNLRITATPAQEGSWGWISDAEVHYRPKEYWQPGTRIRLDANLNGVSAGNGNYGQLNRSLDLTIGRHQTAKVDLQAKQLTLTVAGKAPQTFAVSAGKEGFITRSGTKVIMEKMDKTKMESETTGIARDSAEGYALEVSYALRITGSGEFFHAAPWNEGKFGKVNASHGCTGLSTEQAYAFYDQAQIGDPVEFTGSDRELEWGNGWTEWNLSWDEWKKRSAL